MARCRGCGKDWPRGYLACPDDGAKLSPTIAHDETSVSSPPQVGARPPQNPPSSRKRTPAPPPSGSAVLAPAAGVVELAAGMVVGEYQVEAKVDEGGMGAVYRARHPLIGKKAAIKVISAALCVDSSAVERFVQEARLVNQIGHPNIVDIFSFGKLPDGRSYFVMEWLQGESLAQRMARGGLALAESVEILDQVCDALEAAHETGIIHRDLKPENVYLVAVRGGRQLVKLLDFGIAKLAGDGDVRMQKTRTGMMMGTPGYISPEQARGKEVDHRTDLYALGAMMFEMILGRLPFEADNAMDLVLKHLTEAPPPPSSLWPDIPPALERLILGMLDKDPAKRPALAETRAVLAELRGVVAAGGTVGVGKAAFVSGFAPRIATPSVGAPSVTPSTPAAARPGVLSPGTLGAPTPAAPPATAAVAPEAPAPEPAAPPAAAVAAEAPAPKGHRKRLAIAGGLLLVVVVAAAIVSAGGGAGQSTAEEPAPVAPLVGGAPEKAPERPVAPSMPTPDKPEPPPGKRPAPGTLVVKIGVPNARIELDGKVIAESAAGANIAIADEEEHDLVVTAPKHKPGRRTVKVASGASVEVIVELEPEQIARRPRRPLRGDGEGDEKLSPGVGQGGDYTVDPFAPKKKRRRETE